MESKVLQLHSDARNHVSQFLRAGTHHYIDAAIVLDRAALLQSPFGHPIRIVSLNQLSVHLSDRYSRLGNLSDIEEAISLGRDVLTLCPPGSPDRSMALNNVAARLATRYGRLGGMSDLDEAIMFGKEALVLRPVGHPQRSSTLNNLGLDISVRYQRYGAMEDLDEAIVLSRGALALCPPGHEDRPMVLQNLVRHLSSRYLRLKGMEDIDEAIAFGQEARALCPQGHPGRLLSLNNLASSLFTRYTQLGNVEDVDEAVDAGRTALALCSPGHPDLSMVSNNVALYLSARLKRHGSRKDVDDAIVLDEAALALRPPGHPGRSISLINLAVRLSTRFRQFGTMHDLDNAIALDREALALCPPGHPNRPDTLAYLAEYIHIRFTQTGQPQDKEELFSLYSQVAHMPQTASSSNLSIAKAWIRAAEDYHHPTTLLAYETSLSSLVHHIAALPSLPQHLDVLKDLASSLAVDAFSAGLRNNSPTKATEFLEQGRSVFWSQLARLRSPLDDVVSSGPEGEKLARKFTELTSLIRNAIDSPGTGQHDHVCHLNLELDKVVTAIRELPELSRFLLPSLFRDLQQAAAGGPVIIVNASVYGCDILIILLDRDPVHIPLKITRQRVRELLSELRIWVVRAKTMDVMRYIAVVLREFWEEVISPVVDVLLTFHPPKSRIWWCPTTEFSLIPLHAAGPYKKGEKKLADFYMSSYTPTLTALIRTRRHLDSVTQEMRFVGIGQANAIGTNELYTVGHELVTVAQRVHGLATFTSIEGPDSSIDRVIQELNQNQWAHLACHGIPNQAQPFQSAFALHDGRFTVERIIQCELKHAEFVYLSACHTMVGDADSPDEMIHLASAMQFAGFRSVIGTMWAVDDEQAQKITSQFYDYMVEESGQLDYTRAAFALHETMRKLGSSISFDQRILYVHLGA